MLSNCNTLSASRLKIAGQQFKGYKQILVDIKKDLDYSFKKINVLKTKLQAQYPESVIGTTCFYEAFIFISRANSPS
jgi:hypothetical protein